MPTIWDVSPPCDGAEMMDDQIPPPRTLGVQSNIGVGQWSLEKKHTQKKKFNDHVPECTFIRAILMNNKRHY